MTDGVPDRDVIGVNAYARHQGVSGAAVRKAAKCGRITRAISWGPGGRIEGIRWRLADELWRANTDPTQALRTRKGFPAGFGGYPAVDTSGPPPRPGSPAPQPAPTRADLEQLAVKFLALAFQDSLPTWPAMLVGRYQLTPAIALEVVLDGLLVLVQSLGDRLGLEDIEFLMPDALEWRDGPEQRARLRAEIEKLAPQFRPAVAQTAPAGEASDG